MSGNRARTLALFACLFVCPSMLPGRCGTPDFAVLTTSQTLQYFVISTRNDVSLLSNAVHICGIY
eukprot:1179221-Prorocentrum_minimum.AAC.5